MVRPSKRRHVLVVENDTSMQKLLHSLLAANGYESTSAVGPDSARTSVDEASDTFALAIVDFAPGLNASGVVRALREHPGFAEQPILALTSAARKEDIRHLLDCGCDAYLRKPFHLAEFQEVIVSLILGTPMAPEAATDCSDTDLDPGSTVAPADLDAINIDGPAYGFR